MEEQLLMAQLLRRKQQAEALANANAQGHGLDELSAISQMANNPGAAAAAQMAAKNRQSQYKPLQMGQQGFMLPQSGESVSSPMFEDEQNSQRLFRRSIADQTDAAKEAQRAQQAELARDRVQASKDMQADRLAQQASQNEQNRLLRQSLFSSAEAGRNARDANNGGGNEAKADKEMSRNLAKYTTAMEKAGVPEFDSALGIVEGNLTKYPVGKLPAYGRLLSAVPGFALDNESQGIRADMSQAANILLKARSGAAVTDGEMRRFLQEVASGAGMSEETLRKGWANIRQSFDGKRQNLTTLLDPAGHDEYAARGGKDFRVAPKAEKNDLSPAEQAELAELRKKLGKK